MTLTVQGSVTGPCTIEEDAILTAQGQFDGQIVRNAGTLPIRWDG
jgi:hypothetical protein